MLLLLLMLVSATLSQNDTRASILFVNSTKRLYLFLLTSQTVPRTGFNAQ